MVKRTKEQQELQSETKKIKRNYLLKSCEQLCTAAEQNAGRIPHGLVKSIVNEAKPVFTWINRDIVNFNFKKFQKQKRDEALTAAAAALPETSVTTETTGENRKKGSNVNKNVPMRKRLFQHGTQCPRMRAESRAMIDEKVANGNEDEVDSCDVSFA